MLADVPVACLELRPLLGMRWRMSLAVATSAAIATAIGGHALYAGALGSWGFFLGALLGFQRARLWFRDARRSEESTRLRLVPARGIRSGAGVAPAVAVAAASITLLELTGHHGGLQWIVPTVMWMCTCAAGVDFACAVAIGGWESRTGYRVARPGGLRPLLRGRELTAVPASGRMPAVPRLPHLIPALCVAGVVLAGAAASAVTDPTVDLPPAPAVSYVDPSLSAVALQLGGSAPVTCWSKADWQRFQTNYNEQVAGVESKGRIYLDPTTCRWLTWMQTTHGWPITNASRFWMAQSAGVLTHETGHVLLGPNETNAECFAFDYVGRTLAFLGYPPSQVAELVRIYRTESHPQLPARYLERPCQA